MLIKVNNRFTLIEVDFKEIETDEELREVLGIDDFYPNNFQIVEGTFEEAVQFIDFLCFDSLRVIKNFYGQEFTFFYNPYQHSNDILIQNTNLFSEVKNHLQKFSNFE